MQNSTIPQRVIVLHQNGQHVPIGDEHLRLLGDLTVRQLVATDDPEHGYDVRGTWQSLLRSSDGFRLPNAGCIPLLQERAGRRGIQLVVQASPPIVQLPEASHEDRLQYPGLAQFVRQHERGLIRVPKSFDKAIIVNELTMAFLSRRLIVLGSKVASLDSLTTRLWAMGHQQHDVQLAHGRRAVVLVEDEQMPRVVCSTYREAADLDLATSDIVLLLDAAECVHARAQEALEAIDARFRLFGITRAGQTASPYEAGVTMRVFGPELLDLMSHGRTRREVQVAWVRHNQPTIDMAREGAEYDYRCVWHNERRNRVIAGLAKALADGEPLDGRYGPDAAAWQQNGGGGGSLAVTVLADRLDHAVAIGKKLPDWPIVTGRKVSLYGYPGSVRTRLMRDRRRWLDGRRQIVLTDAAASFRGETSTAVVWAGAGPHGAPVPASWLAQRRGVDRPLLVVDFSDRFNTQARQWSRLRQEEYTERDMFDVGVEPALGRIHRLLGTRPRGGR